MKNNIKRDEGSHWMRIGIDFGKLDKHQNGFCGSSKENCLNILETEVGFISSLGTECF